MTMRATLLFLAIYALAAPLAAQEAEAPVAIVDSSVIAGMINQSLHNTTAGMGYFYAAHNGGFEKFTGIPYTKLACKNCHVTGKDCRQCHADGTSNGFSKPTSSTCLDKCHSRQKAEASRNPNPHMTEYGLECADCHHAADVHGDGTIYSSMLDGAVKARCDQDGCHIDPAALHGDNNIFARHGEAFHCAACHTKATVSCVNCHFESEVDGVGKIANTQVHDWKFLMKYKRPGEAVARVYPGNIQSLTYHDSAFYVIAPFFGHSLSKPDSCADCHAAPAVKMYNDSGYINLLSWNEENGKMEHVSGVIPVPPDWATAFKIDFVTREDDTGRWIFQQHGASENGTQMIIGEPLTKMPEM